MHRFDLSLVNFAGLAVLEAAVLVFLAVVIACFFAAIGGLVRYLTRPPGSTVNASWLMNLGIFAGVPFGIIGMTNGYLTALSRVSAISALVPAALTLVSAVAVYLVGKGGKTALLASFAVINFSTMMIVGGLIGGRERVETEQAINSLAAKYKQSDDELALRQYRYRLGLDPVSAATKTTTQDGLSEGEPRQ
jgi:uncharacterized membrane protein